MPKGILICSSKYVNIVRVVLQLNTLLNGSLLVERSDVVIIEVYTINRENPGSIRLAAALKYG